MKITTLPSLYRNINRWRKIITVLSRYGLADWISTLNLEFVKDQLKDRDGEALARHTREVRIRLALTDLGPTFIKLGQLLSTRPDIAGIQLAEELKNLQSSVPADTPSVARQLIEKDLGQPIDELFSEFDDVAVASASIGQVHRARLKTGERVAVKVQRAGIESVINEDLEVIAGLAQLAEQIEEFQAYRPTATIAEMARLLRRELDFGREERNLQLFSSSFADNPEIKIPIVYSELCTPRVLTMEWIEGIPLSSSEQLIAAGFDLQQLATSGAEGYLKMIFQDGHYHADPHPGNILLLPGNVIGLIDFGMVGRIEERLREDIEEMLMAIVNRDVLMLTSILKRVGSTPPDIDQRGLSSDVADYVAHYANQSLQDFNVSSALNDMFEILHRYQISLPSQVALLIKTLITLEGTTKIMNPSFSLMEVMQPFHRNMLLRRVSPARHLRKMRRVALELEHLAEVLPSRLIEILEQIQSGKFDVHLDHRGLGPSVNRLVLGMLTSALFLGSAMMLSLKVPPLLFPNSELLQQLGMQELSILGLIGSATSILIGLRILRAIMKSGHLDRKE